jgi:hypothetical protein
MGFSENEADDGSGLHAIWGYGMEILEDGNGYFINWRSEIEPRIINCPFYGSELDKNY